MTIATPSAEGLQAGRPVVLRNGTILTMDDGHRVLRDADVLMVGERIAGVGPGLAVPDGTTEIDASGGIVMPGMIDTTATCGRPPCAAKAPAGPSPSTSSATTCSGASSSAPRTSTPATCGRPSRRSSPA